MTDKLKKYKVKAGGKSNVFAISVVSQPAVESSFVALAKQEKPKPVYLSKDDKHMLYGVILRADFPIYRVYEGEEFYIEFDGEAIERLERKYMKNFAQKNWTTEHLDIAEGLTLTESWIVTDLEHDKSKALGLEGVTVGSWVGGCLVDDNEIWAQVKEGTYTGFSVEAFCDLEEITREIKNNKHNSDKIMAKKSVKMDEILENIKNIINDAIDNAEGQDAEVQEEVVEEAAEEVVDTVDNTEETTEETVEAAEETPAEETEPEQVAEEAIETVEDNAETEEQAAEDLQAVVDSLKAEIDTLKAENEELKKKNQKMSKMPSVKPNKATGGEQKFSVIEQLDKMGFIKW